MKYLLHKANEKFELGYAGDEDFYNDAVNELVNMKEDYGRRWLYWVPEAQRRRLQVGLEDVAGLPARTVEGRGLGDSQPRQSGWVSLYDVGPKPRRGDVG